MAEPTEEQYRSLISQLTKGRSWKGAPKVLTKGGKVTKAAAARAAKLVRGGGVAGIKAGSELGGIPAGPAALGLSGHASKLLGMLGKGDVGGAFSKYPGTMGMGGLFLLSLLTSKILGAQQQLSDIGLQRGAIEQQAGMSPDDMYYQAMMPELAQERRGAQQALVQAILGDQQIPTVVPGERMIGG